jgi:glycosyltransferase involved in cell wall biosynthesis
MDKISMNTSMESRMVEASYQGCWHPGTVPVAVVMIALNEEHNMEEVCQNLAGWAQEVFLVDSYSQDDTVDIALRNGVHVVQRRFRGFGDQWNFALKELPIRAPWTMKLDPDERLSPELKDAISRLIQEDQCDGIAVVRRWWFMGKPLSICDTVLRLWRTGTCRFGEVLVNEYPKVAGRIRMAEGFLEHLDSPDLEHWINKQNHYSTMEAISFTRNLPLAESPSLFGSALQRRMWFKRHFRKIPFRYTLLFLYFWLWKGLWRSGWVGYASAKLWTMFYFVQECKVREILASGRLPQKRCYGLGDPDPRVAQYE